MPANSSGSNAIHTLLSESPGSRGEAGSAVALCVPASIPTSGIDVKGAGHKRMRGRSPSLHRESGWTSVPTPGRSTIDGDDNTLRVSPRPAASSSRFCHQVGFFLFFCAPQRNSARRCGLSRRSPRGSDSVSRWPIEDLAELRATTLQRPPENADEERPPAGHGECATR